MAAKKKNGDAAANAGATGATGAAGTDSGTAGTATSTTRPRDTEATIYWNKARDLALINLLVANPGRLTTTAVCEKLASDPAFAEDAHLLATDKAPDKIRQRVVKINKGLEKRGKTLRLELKRLNNSGYDMDGTLDMVLGSLEGAQGGVPVDGSGAGGVVPTTQAHQQTQAPAFDGGVPLVAPQAPTPAPQFLGATAGVTGGLIPTP